MIKEKRYFAYFLLLILAPEIALANIAIPMLFFSWPGMFAMFVPIVIVEYIVLKKRWPWVNKKILRSSIGLGNLVSTLVGIPISWCLYYFGITLPLDFLIYDPNSLSKSFLSSLQVFAEIFAGATFIYEVSTPLNSDLIIYIKLVLMLLPAYFLSYWIEVAFLEIDGISKKEALAGARSANRYSYLFVLIVVAIFFTAHYVKLFLRHYNW
jgi:hypothetical protein